MDKSIRDKYRVVIGLEVHAQLLTESKAFSSDSTEYGQMPNTNISVVTMGHPGTLPMLNKKVVEYAIKAGIACGCNITEHNIFARKNYFYPDLPKGYQISQDKTPICTGGAVKIRLKSGEEKNIGITRIHMEEDAGKSMHLEGETETLVDYNRAGVPLIEMVSEPDMTSGEEAYQYLTEVRKLVRYLGICDGNMEEGSLRCDANISVMLKDAKQFGTKVEVKNMNSIRNVQRAIEHEVDRQIKMVEAGQVIDSDTRSFDATTGTTTSMRSKETLNDYRYFPEPDLQPLIIDEEWISRIKAEMPSLPNELYDRFTKEMGLPEYDAGVLTDSKEIALYFEDLCSHTDNYKAASNWVMGPVKSHLNELTLHIKDFPIAARELAGLIKLIESGKVSHSIAQQQIFPEMLKRNPADAEKISTELNLMQMSDDSELERMVKTVLADNLVKVNEYKAGKTSLLGMFMGQVMKKTQGKADPKKATEMLNRLLNS